MELQLVILSSQVCQASILVCIWNSEEIRRLLNSFEDLLNNSVFDFMFLRLKTPFSDF